MKWQECSVIVCFKTSRKRIDRLFHLSHLFFINLIFIYSINIEVKRNNEQVLEQLHSSKHSAIVGARPLKNLTQCNALNVFSRMASKPIIELETFLSLTEKSCIVLYYNQFSTNIKIKIIIFIPVLTEQRSRRLDLVFII